MDFDEEGGCLRNLFRAFVCTALTMLLGLHVYNYMKDTDAFDGDFTDIKYVVMQLSKGLTEVNRKHERLQSELARVTAALPPAVTARGRDALEHSGKKPTGFDVQDYDRQMIDYALESAGARVVDTGNTVEHAIYESPVGWALHVLTAWACRECLGARTILQPGTLPGECWAFKGLRGEAVIRLLGSVHITDLATHEGERALLVVNTLCQSVRAYLWRQLAHERRELTAPSDTHTNAFYMCTFNYKEISSAPRLFQLEGLEYRSDVYPHDFGTFEYSKNGKPIQFFEVLHPAPKAYHMVRLRVLSNWGNPVYTCVYRVRIHGDLAVGPSTEDPELRIDNEQ